VPQYRSIHRHRQHSTCSVYMYICIYDIHKDESSKQLKVEVEVGRKRSEGRTSCRGRVGVRVKTNIVLSSSANRTPARPAAAASSALLNTGAHAPKRAESCASLTFTRYYHHLCCMVYGIYKGESVWGGYVARWSCTSNAIVWALQVEGGNTRMTDSHNKALK